MKLENQAVKKKWLKICKEELSKGYDSPLLLLSIGQVKENVIKFKTNFPNLIPHYAVKSNPHIEILKVLNEEGVNFEIASEYELDLLKSLNISAERILFSNPVKRIKDIINAYEYGVEWFVIDCVEEMIKIFSYVPKAKIYLRIEVSNDGADYPLSKKFGCKKSDIQNILSIAQNKNINLCGLTFHVGSQNRQIDKWVDAIHKCKKIMRDMLTYGLKCEMLNIGGGFPVEHTKKIPSIEQTGLLIEEALKDKIFKDIKLVAEPGRFMTNNVGWMITRVILDTIKDHNKRIYLDAGIFSGLVEPKEGIYYDWLTDKDDDEKVNTCIAGPTCDSLDIIQNNAKLPKTLSLHDFVYIPNCAAYTLTYATGDVYGFNGFENPKIKIID